MIKVSVLYPNQEGKKFDMKYYCEKHMPMVRDTLGAACKGIAVEQGLGGPTPGARAAHPNLSAPVRRHSSRLRDENGSPLSG